MIARLTTDRLVLRGPVLADFERVLAFFASDRSRWVGGPEGRAQVWAGLTRHAGQWMLRGYGFWMAGCRATGALIGRARIWHPEGWPEPELSWALFDAADERRGLATEMLIAARQGAADLGVIRPIRSIRPDNAASLRLAARVGAVADGARQSPYGRMLRFRHPAP